MQVIGVENAEKIVGNRICTGHQDLIHSSSGGELSYSVCTFRNEFVIFK